MSRLLTLLELAPGATTTRWIGPASGPEGKRAFGGQFVAQSLAAACRTVDSDRMPTNMHLQFLRGGEAGDPVEYSVTPVFDGRTSAARRVDARQDGRLLTTATVSFAVRPARARTRAPGRRCPATRRRCRGPGLPGPLRRCRWTRWTFGSPTTHRRRVRPAVLVAGDGSATRRPADSHAGRGIRHRRVHDRPALVGARAFDEGPHPPQRHDRLVDLVSPAGPGDRVEPAGDQVARRGARARRRHRKPGPCGRRRRGDPGAGRAYRRTGTESAVAALARAPAQPGARRVQHPGQRHAEHDGRDHAKQRMRVEQRIHLVVRQVGVQRGLCDRARDNGQPGRAANRGQPDQQQRSRRVPTLLDAVLSK